MISNFTGFTSIIFIIALGILASVGTAAFNGHLFETSFADLSDDSEYYNARALSLIHTGSLGEEQALFRRPPAYSIFLAGMYGVFGKQVAAAWLGHVLLFSASLFLLWRISGVLLPPSYVVLVPLAAGLYWGFNFYVFEIGSELLAIFLILLLVWLFFRYRMDPQTRYMVMAGVAGSILVLTKPVALYIVPIVLVWMAYEKTNIRATIKRAGAAFFIIFIFVGGWMVRTYLLFGEAQIERAGHIVYTRSLYGSLAWRDIGMHTLAAVSGDYVADKVMKGYGPNPIAQQLGVERKALFSRLLQEGYTRAEAEDVLMRLGIAEIIRRPGKFLAGTVPILFDLNTPENGRGFPVTRMFVGTRDTIPPLQKVSIILGTRGIWFLFLAVAVTGAYKAVKSNARFAWLLIFLIAYFNIAHALLIIPAEPRFLVPVLPFYFLFFVVGARSFIDKLFTKRII